MSTPPSTRPEERTGPVEPGEPEDERTAPPDLRLVPAALATWAAVLCGLLGGPAGGIAAALVAATTVLTALVRSRLSARAAAPGSILLAAGGCACVAAVLITGHASVVAAHPLRALAERGAAAEVRIVLTDDPRAIRSAGGGDESGSARRSVLVPAELRTATAGDGHWGGGGKVLLIAPAEGWEGLLPGQEASAAGLLAPAQRPDLTVAVLRVRGPAEQVSAPPWWQTGAGTLRDGLRGASAATMEPAPAGLLPGLAIGDTRSQLPETEQDFRASGLAHLTAVSGANVAILTGAVLLLLRLFRADPRIAAAVALLALVGFVILARPSPSVLRAAVMGTVVLLALAAGRARSAVPALAGAVLVLLVVDPALAVDAGFALSVVATGALVLFAPGWAARLRARGIPPGPAEALVVPVAAALATAPIIAGLSGQIGLVTVVANLLAAPAVAPATVLGVLAAVLSPLSPDAAAVCTWLASPFVRWLVTVGDRAAAVPGATVPWPAGTGGALLLTGMLVVLLAMGRVPRLRALLLAALIGLLLVLVPTRFVTPGWPPPVWRMIVCDVGQGDGLVLATGVPGEAVLVDTGPTDDAVDACLDRLGVRTIALILITHLHSDHVGGVAGAMRGRPTGAVAVGPVRDPVTELAHLTRTAADAGTRVVGVTRGAVLTWPALRLDVLGPVDPPVSVDGEDGTAVNDISVVTRARTPAGSVMLTGDIELAAQDALIASGQDLRADVLKLPHHGSRKLSPRFVAAVRPRAAVVSVGNGNSYHHPNPGLMDALARSGIAIGRTDRDGDVALTGNDPGGLSLVERGDPRPAPTKRKQGAGKESG
ncbi:ComEC/Rec2 family competence protein [Pseudonocardia phyllosphaerae]|uniref:ComEC/Rec2 family competence protein n=1 Tax=Pseudonocardia phyllosphaerae TaxID=3390502 RepID=UPI00397E7C46